MKGQQRKSAYEKVRSFHTAEEAEKERLHALAERERYRAERADSRLTGSSRNR